MPLVFEWDERKDRSNLKKHGVGFAEAALVFTNPLARIFADEDQSAEEQREIIIGHSPAFIYGAGARRRPHHQCPKCHQPRAAAL